MTVVLIDVGAGSLIRETIGFDFSLVVSPIMLLMETEAAPVTILVHLVPITVVMIARELRSVDRRACLELSIGWAVGTRVEIRVRDLVPPQFTCLLLGVIVLGAVAMSPIGQLVVVFTRQKVIAVAVSGIAGTATALGGPPSAPLSKIAAAPRFSRQWSCPS